MENRDVKNHSENSGFSGGVIVPSKRFRTGGPKVKVTTTQKRKLGANLGILHGEVEQSRTVERIVPAKANEGEV